MGRYSVDILERLASKSIVDETTECWLFLGCKHNQGYGHIRLRYPSGMVEKVHRVAARIFMGYEAGDRRIQVNHILECPNKNCWNPKHLYLGSQKQNVADTIALDRHNVYKPGHPRYGGRGMPTETIKEVEENDDNSSKPKNETDDEIVDMDELTEIEAEENEVKE